MFHFTPTRQRPTGLAVLLAVSLVLLPGLVQAGDWKGQEVTEEGVLHVKNPAVGMEKPTTIELEEMWRVGGYDDDEIFGVIASIIVDEQGTFYMLDGQLNEIKVYGNDGEYLRTIGREGEGPGEFRNAFNMAFLPNGNIGVMQTAPGKVASLTPEGEPADDFPLPAPKDGAFRILFGARNAGDNLALVYAHNQPSEEKFVQSNVLALVSSDGSTETKLHSASSQMDFSSVVIAEKEWDSFRNRWTSSADGRVFTIRDFGEYRVTVWGPDGSIDRIIERDYPVHERSEEEFERIEKIYEGFTRNIPLPDIKYEIEKVHSDVAQLHTRPDGTLWVMPSRGQYGLAEGEAGKFDVFDAKGRLVQQVTFQGEGNPLYDGYFFVGDYFFVVTDFLQAIMALQSGGASTEEYVDEEPEPMQVICYRINGARLGMR